MYVACTGHLFDQKCNHLKIKDVKSFQEITKQKLEGRLAKKILRKVLTFFAWDFEDIQYGPTILMLYYFEMMCTCTLIYDKDHITSLLYIITKKYIINPEGCVIAALNLEVLA